MFRSAMSHISLKAPDPESAAAFYEDFLGMVREAPDTPSTIGAIRLGFGRGHHVVEIVQGEVGLDHFAFEIGDESEMLALKSRLQANGVDFLPCHAERAASDSFAIADPDGNRVEFHGLIDRSGEKSDRLCPDRIQHLALATPDASRLTRFYTEVLGFRISDKMGEGAGFWIRSSQEHHSLAIFQREHGKGLDHYSFDIAGWEDFKVWCDHFSRKGVPVAWGPGRHGIGDNLFIMFHDAVGYLIEFSAEMELFGDGIAKERERWDDYGRAASLWGPVPEFRNRQVEVVGDPLSDG
ncbi:VOC family protein [Streptomyces guryensis]|uniref:VOC family protein n=1 Tax=Streptomyces guryensis TaxID=2886947 RepID=A0A9Q3VXU5_9ACTN|nr:VOC family protein [Streptomyces guryensis]MCD9878950.1 VOC family protein [Streptomyces guryensis]